MAIRDISPKLESRKFGIPAAPLLTMVRSPSGVEKFRKAARQVCVLAKMSMRRVTAQAFKLRTMARVVEHVVRKIPAGERPGVAMHDRDLRIADCGDKMHRQPGKALRRVRNMSPATRRRVIQDQIGAIDDAVVDIVGIGAAASGADVVTARNLGFDIAADRHMRADAAFNLRKPFALRVEPVKIAVEDDGDVRFFFRCEPFDNIERRPDFRRGRRQHRECRSQARPAGRTREANSDNRPGTSGPLSTAPAHRRSRRAKFIPRPP